MREKLRKDNLGRQDEKKIKTKEKSTKELGKLHRQSTKLKVSETASKRMGEKLWENRELYYIVTEAAFAGIAIADTHENLTFVNPAFAEMLGYSEEELVGMNLSQMIDQEEFVKYQAQTQLRRKGVSNRYESKIRCKDRTILTVLVSASPLIAVDGSFEGSMAVISDITERKKMEHALQESEQKYKDVVDKSPVGLYIIQNHLLKFCNQKFVKMFGYKSNKELLGKHIKILVSPETWELVDKKLKSRKKELVQYEFRGVKKDGAVFDIEAFSSQIIYNSKPAIQGSMIDITERKQWEMMLRKSEREKALILHSTSDLISFQDRELKIIWANKAVHESDDSKAGSVLGRHCYEIWPKRSEPCEGCPVVKTFETDRFQKHEITTSDNRVWDVQSYPVRGKDGNVTGAIEVVREITESKQFEQILSRIAAQWTATFDAIHDSVCLLDMDRKILRCNKSFAQLSGKSFLDIIGHNCCEIIHGVSEPKENCPVKDMKDKCQTTTEIMQLADSRWLNVTADPIVDEHNNLKGAVLILADITEQKKMEEEFLNVQRLESLGILAGGIAHDFNNILAAILGNIEILELNTDPESKNFERLKKAKKAVSRAKDLVQQLMTFSKGGMPVKKTVSITDAIKDTAIFALRGSNTSCEFHIPDDLWPVDVDKGQISQVISNIILNAEEAMAKGGTIHVRAENIKVGAKDRFGLRKGEYVRISIEDYGCGIPEECLSKIFDPYYTTKDRGSGLGLAISYSVIKKHGGYITVDSKLGVGTTFNIYLSTSKKTPSETKLLEKKLFLGKGRILVVDDEESIREVAAEMLSYCGYEVVLVKDGAEAIKLYKQEREAGSPFDVVIMDLTIPGGMGGKEAITKLSTIDPIVKVIASSGYSNDPIMANFRKYGFSGAIAKPYKIKELSKIVHNVISSDDA